MLKYLKYYLSTLLLISAIIICSIGGNSPTIYFICFSSIIILGDIFLGKDVSTEKYSYPFLINLPIYINIVPLVIFLTMVVYIFGNQGSLLLVNFYNRFLFIDLIHIKDGVTIFDGISLILLSALFIGLNGVNPGHELTHRKKDKLNMFFGNWLLAFSWDCAFALEHVYGHHKNVGLPTDPATAKRGEGLYRFILSAIIKEQHDAWLIEFDHLKKRGHTSFGIHNKMLIGYTRSLLITIGGYLIGGIVGMTFYLLCALLAKSFLEVI